MVELKAKRKTQKIQQIILFKSFYAMRRRFKDEEKCVRMRKMWKEQL